MKPPHSAFELFKGPGHQGQLIVKSIKNKNRRFRGILCGFLILSSNIDLLRPRNKNSGSCNQNYPSNSCDEYNLKCGF